MTRKHHLRLPAGWNERQGEWSELDRELGLPTLSEIKVLAARQVESKAPLPGDRIPPRAEELAKRIMGEQIRTEDRETYTRRWIGLFGERQAARELGVRMKLDVRPSGDHRTNLITRRGVPVDVLTRRQPAGWSDLCPDLLLHERDAERPELALVLVVFAGSAYDAYVVGWEWEYVVRAKAKVTDHQGHVSLEYPPEWLRPISALLVAQPFVVPPKQGVLV